MTKILLIGNPNVGKSVIFSRLTGVDVISSNYPGTTVEFTKGYLKHGQEKAEIIDIPGTYTLEPTCKAEEIAVDMVKSGDLIINVIDATKLERNLNLTMDLLKQNVPMIIVLNFWDEVKHAGIIINIEELEKMLKVPVIPVCGVTGEGIKELVDRLSEAKVGKYKYNEKEKWCEIGKITNNVQKLFHRHHTIFDRLSEISIKPITGIPIALGVIYLIFKIIRFIGEGLITYLFEPLFVKLWLPLMMKLSHVLTPGSFIHDIIIGHLINGQIDFGQSFGILTTGLFVPIAMILPYVFAFYLVLSFLEDSGYLPRLAVMLDGVMHIVGLHGLSIIPFLLGLGCNVPGVLATRIMDTRRERFICSTILAISVPCMAKMSMIVGLVGPHGTKPLMIIFGTLFLIWVILGSILHKIYKGDAPEIFVEIPPYRIPYMRVILKKLWIRVKWFLKEAIPFVFLGVIIINMLYSLKIINFAGNLLGPVLMKLFGIPSEAIAAIIVGFLRKDVAVGMLAPLHLTLKQLIIASVVLSMYFPCAATFSILLKEFGIKDMIKATLIMIISTIIVGVLLNLII